MFLRFLKYFRLVGKLKQKRNLITGWRKFISEEASDNVIKTVAKRLLKLKAKDITLEYNLRTGFIKSKKAFIKYSELSGSFKVNKTKSVTFSIYSYISPIYYMSYKINENKICIHQGANSIINAFSEIKNFIKNNK